MTEQPIDLVNLLTQMPVFGGLKHRTLEFVLEHARTKEFDRGTFLFEEGQQADSLFVMRRGRVVVEKDWQGTPIQLGEFAEGDCLGEMAIIDLQCRSASVRALTDCLALEISRKTLHQLYRQDLEQFAIIMMNMGREVSRRLRTASDRLFELDRSLPAEVTE